MRVAFYQVPIAPLIMQYRTDPIYRINDDGRQCRIIALVLFFRDRIISQTRSRDLLLNGLINLIRRFKFRIIYRQSTSLNCGAFVRLIARKFFDHHCAVYSTRV